MGALLKGELGAKLARWLFYSVLISLAPIFLDFVVLQVRKPGSHSVLEVLSHGELFLLSAAFLCVGLGEIIGTSDKFKVIKIIVGGLNAVTLISVIGLYVTSKNMGEPAGNALAGISVWLFLMSALFSTSCIAISGAEHA